MTEASDAALFADLRALWQDVDPIPASLIDRMITAVAADGLSHEYALLSLVENATAAVRSATDALTLQFSDGSTNILLHVTTTASGAHRVDGWVDSATAEIVLTQGSHTRTTAPSDHGRFVFDDVPSGLTTVSLTTTTPGANRTLATPQFEV